ncbi:hypothetical protein ACHMWN_08615 [Pedobacter sp. UC225_61]|uniref:hypothetical protein n=1 Tax=Pedobacter sp. UC225_61 TaxID=3374623 RepID=UPI0037A739D1
MLKTFTGKLSEKIRVLSNLTKKGLRSQLPKALPWLSQARGKSHLFSVYHQPALADPVPINLFSSRHLGWRILSEMNLGSNLHMGGYGKEI